MRRKSLFPIFVVILGFVAWWLLKGPADAPLSSDVTEAPVIPTDAKAEMFRLARLRKIKVGSPNLDVHLTTKKWCSGGDIDVIKLELEHSARKRLLISVESLSDKNAPLNVPARELTLEEVIRGGKYTFQLPERTGPFQFGVYLCKDSEGTGHCRGKPAANAAETFYKYTVKKKGKLDQSSAADKIYFFQYGLMEAPGTLSAFEEGAVSDDAFSNLFRYLSTFSGAAESQQAWRDGVEAAKERTHRVSSMPLESREAGIQVVLPMYDKPSCREQLWDKKSSEK